MRKHPFATDTVHHLMNKSIASYEIFKYSSDYSYFTNALQYFTLPTPPSKFSYFYKHDAAVQQDGFKETITNLIQKEDRSIKIIAYCIMPTHFHILAKQPENNSITTFIRNTLNAYTRYFNIKHERKGPLWVGPFHNVPVLTDEQLLHIIRYIHLNPTTAGLTKKPENWLYSSYHEYTSPDSIKYPITNHDGLFNMSPQQHQLFTENQQDYQRSLAIIKKQILE